MADEKAKIGNGGVVHSQFQRAVQATCLSAKSTGKGSFRSQISLSVPVRSSKSK